VPDSIRVRAASLEDVPTLVRLMGEFYAEAGYPLPTAAATRAFRALLADSRAGRAWLLAAGGEPAGYVVLTLGFGMEYGGLRGWVDDLFVRPAARGQGLAAAALATVRTAARELGVRALVVEVGPENAVARRLYARAGFAETGRLLLAQPLAPAVHEADDGPITDSHS
jgi:GNAT superfamily N-acetyltransferase